jgi:hypothetical protein
MLLTDFPSNVWEILLGMLQARHHARLAATGDVLTRRALTVTWRELDLFFLGDEFIQARKTVIASGLVKDLLIQYTRRLTIDAEDFSRLSTPLPLLTLLMIRQSAFGYEAFLKNITTAASTFTESDGGDFVATRLDLARLTPGLKELIIDAGSFEFGLVLPMTLEKLALNHDDCDAPMRQIENIGELLNLTTVVVDTRREARLIHEDTVWPPNMTDLTTSLLISEIAAIFHLPQTLRRLKIVNKTAVPVATGVFRYLPLVELIITDAFAMTCSRLTTVPPTLTALTLDTLCTMDGAFYEIGEDTFVARYAELQQHVLSKDTRRDLAGEAGEGLESVLRRLPDTLTSITIGSIPPSIREAEEFSDCLHWIMPKMDVSALSGLAYSLADNTSSTGRSIFSRMATELEKRGCTGGLVAQVATVLSALLASKHTEGQLEIMKTIAADGKIPRPMIKTLFNMYWDVTGRHFMDDYKSEETRFAAQYLENGLPLKFRDNIHLSEVPEEVARHVTSITTCRFPPPDMDVFLSSKFERLARLVISDHPPEYGKLLAITEIVVRHAPEFPLLETITLDVPSDASVDQRATIDQEMTAIRFYPTSVSGEYKFRVSPPSGNQKLPALFDVMKFMYDD